MIDPVLQEIYLCALVYEDLSYYIEDDNPGHDFFTLSDGTLIKTGDFMKFLDKYRNVK